MRDEGGTCAAEAAVAAAATAALATRVSATGVASLSFGVERLLGAPAQRPVRPTPRMATAPTTTVPAGTAPPPPTSTAKTSSPRSASRSPPILSAVPPALPAAQAIYGPPPSISSLSSGNLIAPNYS